MTNRAKQANRKRIALQIESCELALSDLYNQRLQLESEYQKCLDAKKRKAVTKSNSDHMDIKYEDNDLDYIGADTSLAHFTSGAPQQNSIDILNGIINYEESSFPATTSHANITSANTVNLNLSVPNIKTEFEEEHDEDEIDFDNVDKKDF